MIDLLGSPEVAIDDHHSPKLYSRFLQGLLDKLQSRGADGRRLKAKSESPAAHKTELHDALPRALRPSRSSPASVRDSASPEPKASALLEPFGGAAVMTQEPSELMPIDAANEFFAPPLPFNELLPSMNDSSILGVPGEPSFPFLCAPSTCADNACPRRLRLDERAPARVPAWVLPASHERALDHVPPPLLHAKTTLKLPRRLISCFCCFLRLFSGLSRRVIE